MKIKTCGVYFITNPENKIYIGCTTNLERRKINHEQWRAFHPKSRSPLLVESFKKFNQAEHKFEVMYVLPDDTPRKELQRYEALAIKVIEKLGFESLNIIGSGKNKFKRKRVDNDYQKAIRSGKNKSFKPRPHTSLKISTPVIAFKKDTNQIVGEYLSIREAAIAWNLRTSQVTDSINEKHKPRGSVYFLRKGKKKERIKTINNNGRYISKPIIQQNFYGEEIARFKSVKDAATSTNINRGNIGTCANGKAQSAGGYVWKWA